MSATHHDKHAPESHGASGAEAGFEPDRPPTSGISVFVFGLLVIIVVSIAGVVAFVKDETAYRRLGVNPAGQALLDAAKQADREALTTYGEVDAAKKVYRLPIDQAIKTVAADPSLLGPLPRLLPDPGTGQGQ